MSGEAERMEILRLRGLLERRGKADEEESECAKCDFRGTADEVYDHFTRLH